MDVEQLLRASTPEPDPGFVRSLESDLFPRRERRQRPLLAAAGLVAALACTALGLSLAGVGPLGGGNDGVQADSNCKFVTVTARSRRLSWSTAGCSSAGSPFSAGSSAARNARGFAQPLERARQDL